MKEILNKYVGNYSFEFIQNVKLRKILYMFSGYVSMHFDEILYDDLEKELKEIKSHTILVYLGSIIEAIIYYFAEIKLTDEKSKRKYLEVKEFRPLVKIPETENIYNCKLETKEITFNDSINFYALINGIKDKKLLNDKIIEKIDYCRKMRNLIHANVLLTSEYKLGSELDKVFTYTKEIIDDIKSKLK